MAFIFQSVFDALSLGALYALVAIGVALIFGILRMMNFAHGEVIVAGGFAALFAAPYLPLWLTIPTVLLACLVTAIIIDQVAFRPVRGANDATLLVSSFAVSYLMKNLMIMTFGSLPRTIELAPFLAGTWTIGDLNVQRLSITSILMVLVSIALLGWLLKFTALGLQMRAAAEDFTMARLLGVRANRVIMFAFAASGILAGIASLLIVVQTGAVSTSIGLMPVLIAFVAVVIGGLGSLRGAVIGGLTLGILTGLLQAFLPPELRYFRDAFAFVVVIGVLILRPNGIIISRSRLERV